MKLYISTLFLSGILVFAPTVFAQSEPDQPSAEQIAQETKELLSTLKDYTVDKKDDALAHTKSAMDNLDQRIDALEARIDRDWDAMSEATRKQARESMQTLRNQRNKVAEWYGSMKVSGGEAWSEVKQGFSDAYQTLSDSWRKSEQDVPPQN